MSWKREITEGLPRTLCVFVLACAIYAFVDAQDVYPFFRQALLTPAIVGFGMLFAILPVEVDRGWLDIDVPGKFAQMGRALVFGSMAALFYLAVDLRQRNPTRSRNVAVIAFGSFIVLTLVFFVLFFVALDRAWRD